MGKQQSCRLQRGRHRPQQSLRDPPSGTEARIWLERLDYLATCTDDRQNPCSIWLLFIDTASGILSLYGQVAVEKYAVKRIFKKCAAFIQITDSGNWECPGTTVL